MSWIILDKVTLRAFRFDNASNAVIWMWGRAYDDFIIINEERNLIIPSDQLSLSIETNMTILLNYTGG